MRLVAISLLVLLAACGEDAVQVPVKTPDAARQENPHAPSQPELNPEPAPEPDPEPAPEPIAPYFRESTLFEIPDDGRVEHHTTNESGTAVALLVRRKSGYRLLVSGQEPFDYRGRIQIQPQFKAYHAVQPAPGLVDTDRHVIGDEIAEHTWLAWGQDQPAASYLKFDSSGKRVAFVLHDKGKWRMVVDARPDEAFDRVRAPVFDPGGQHYAYVASRGEKELVVVDGKPGPEFDSVNALGPQFSADGGAVAYVATVGKKSTVVIHPKAGTLYEKIYASTLRLSSDGSRYLYLARQDNQGFAVINGEESERFEQLGSVVTLAEDGTRSAFAGFRAGKWHFVLDGKIGPAYDGVGIHLFSPNGRRFAYGARNGTRFSVYLDGEKGPEFDGVSFEFVFGPDSKRFAYSGTRGGRRFAVIDGKEGAACQDMYGPFFSRTHAFHGEIRRGKLALFVDGEERWSHAGQPLSKMIFSPDGERAGYSIHIGGTSFHCVVDGELGPAFGGTGEPAFSADSKHVAYSGGRAIGEGKSRRTEGRVVLDGTPQPKYRYTPVGPRFTEDGVLTYCGFKDDKWHVVVGEDVRVYDRLYHGTSRRFEMRDDGSLEYIAQRGREILRIEHKP